MNNTTIVDSAFVSPEELWKSRRLLPAKAYSLISIILQMILTLFPTIIVNYMAIMLLLTEFSRQKSPPQLIIHGDEFKAKRLTSLNGHSFPCLRVWRFCNTGMISCKGHKGTL